MNSMSSFVGISFFYGVKLWFDALEMCDFLIWSAWKSNGVQDLTARERLLFG